jgi:hypothetical protein
MPVRRLLIALAITIQLIFVASAHAYVYWGDPSAGTIGRADNDGSSIDDAFIKTGGNPDAIAINATYIYWANESAGTIGRANIDGTEVEPNFIKGIKEPQGVAVNSTSIYWASLGGHEIGRANLNGTGVNLGLVTGAGTPCSLTLDSGHIYWGNFGTPAYLGRASLTGSEPNSVWVGLGSVVPCGLAVNSANVFFADTGFLGHALHEIGRVNLVGTPTAQQSIIGDAEGPCGMTIFDSRLYWTNQGNGTIGVANTDATAVDESLISTGAVEPCGVAVDSLSSPLTPSAEPPPSAPSSPVTPSSPAPSSPAPVASAPSLHVVGDKLDTKNGTARVEVTVSGSGLVSVQGKGIVAAVKKAYGAETVSLSVRPAKAKKSMLRRLGHLRAKLSISFAPSAGGGAPTAGTSLTLVEKKASPKK